MFAILTFLAVPFLSLEEKVGQVLMVHFHGEELNEDARALIEKAHVGGVIYYTWANGLQSLDQVAKLSKDLQDLSRVPLLISTDQEGGIVSRLQKDFTTFPGNMALGMTKDPELAFASAFASGQELLAAGINMNLAPVVDVNQNPKNPVIGIRSFGSDPKEVALFGEKALEGYKTAGVIACLKHFPGHGDVETDSHYELPTVNKTKEELFRQELLPFAFLAQSSEAIMTAHIMVPALDPNSCSTLSRPTLQFLREELGFEGLILSDSLTMQGVLKQSDYSLETAAIQAFDAGCDMLILGGRELLGCRIPVTVEEIIGVHRALVHAVEEGRISEKRLDASVQRILDLKEKYALPMKRPPEFSFKEHHKLSSRIARFALQTIQRSPLPCLDCSSIAFFAPELVHIEKTSLLTLGSTQYPLFFSSLEPTISEWVEAESRADQADVVIFCSYNAWKHPAQAALLQNLIDKGKPVILIVLRDPLDAELFPNTCLTLTTFSPTQVSIQAAYDELLSRNN
jgi:beta-N-acetylhexosaminidase